MSGTRQQRHAANAGDRLKHALLANVAQRLGAGRMPWSYAETHAGAGAYATPRATELRAALAAAPPLRAMRTDPGATYARALRRWWRPAAAHRSGLYPGSPPIALLVGRFSRAQFCEAEPRSARRLERILAELRSDSPALDAVEMTVHAGSFVRRVDRLLPLGGARFLLADPYCYDPEASSAAGGRIGRRHLAALAAAGSRARDCLLAVFTSRRPGEDAARSPAERRASAERHAPAERGAPTEQLLRDLRAAAPQARVRGFRAAGTPHGVVLGGWGAGARRVAALPAEEEWTRSWLARPPVCLDVREVGP
ncbi:MAG: hypothetical protein GF330_07695 [Candidatus Eisenbacteria bacterium]|nr:hypothetical protein [Candidatus Eisenbacteria bacterium]